MTARRSCSIAVSPLMDKDRRCQNKIRAKKKEANKACMKETLETIYIYSCAKKTDNTKKKLEIEEKD